MASNTTTKKKNGSGAEKKPDTRARKNTRADNFPPPQPPARPIHREVSGVVFLFLAVFMVIACFNTDGAFIAFFADLVKGLIGWGFWLTAPVFLLLAYILLFHKGRPVSLRVSAALLLPVIVAAMLQLMLCDSMSANFEFKAAVGLLFEQGQALACGGVAGGLIAAGLEMAFSVYGAVPLLIVALVFCLIAALNIKLSDLFGRSRERAAMAPPAAEPPAAKHSGKERTRAAREEKRIERIPRGSFPIDIPLGDDDEALPFNDLGLEGEKSPEPEARSGHRAKVRRKSDGTDASVRPAQPGEAVPSVPDGMGPAAYTTEISDPPRVRKISRDEVEAEAKAMAGQISAQKNGSEYQFPPIDLLRGSTAGTIDAREEIMLNRDRLEGAIRSFGISAAIVGVTRGPTVTRYDIELDQGVKLARVTNLAGDLALALGVINVRIAPIPDKISTVGIEVPNKIVSTVYLRDIIESARFTSAKSRLSFALGKDIGGECIVGNIAKLPHMLIAGTTGSGKSVCMNSLILSILYKARPDEVRLIMIDPKMVELGVYNGIPHLYVPVVTDPKKAAGALQWSVVEMLKRYRLFSEAGVRDLANYNRHCEAAGEDTLPQVVIVIDELADLMLVASKEVEESICRVAQMGRAAGMHLVIATQRPSADVITGLMKANIPSRIAFAVSSAMESRIILDQAGAEKLVGMGDMLFSPVGCGKPTRIQGAFVSDDERENVIQFIKEGAGEAQQNNEIEEFMNKAAEDKGSSDGGKGTRDEGALEGYDEMLPQAAEVVIEAGSCSVSMLQRRAKLGYSRAARIVDQMEELGIVGPYEGAKPRQVLVDRAGWHDIQVQLGLAADEDMALAAEMNENQETYDFEG